MRFHPWRSLAAVTAVMLGVALAFAVHLINASAVSEFSSAVRSATGEPDLELRAVRGTFDETFYERIAADPRVALASPVLEANTYALDPAGARKPLRIVGVDALAVAGVAPSLMPRPVEGADRFALFAPRTVFLNGAARAAFGGGELRLQVGSAFETVRVAGSVAAAGAPMAVMDIGAAQDLLGRGGQLSRIDLRLVAGADAAALRRELAPWPGIAVATSQDDEQRVNRVSRAYRVNLTVLALVALFTGSFLVFSVLALSVARRAPQFALLGVLGLTPHQRLRLVVMESAAIGVAGSAAGIALGTALAATALRFLQGDLGGGYFPGIQPQLHWDGGAAIGYGALGALAAVAGGWLPARAAQSLALAPTLKGLAAAGTRRGTLWLPATALAAGTALTQAPPLFGIPLAAYFSVALLLFGGIGLLPALVGLAYDRIAPLVATRALPLLAVERARRVRETAAVAVSGVVAALSLAVALTVMVASFRDSVARWLDVLLPADLYVRAAATSGAGDTVFLDPAFVGAIAALPGVRSVTAQRTTQLLLDPAQPPVVILARDLPDARRDLPLVGEPVATPDGMVPIYVSEAMVDLHGAKPGAPFAPFSEVNRAAQRTSAHSSATFFVAGVWRDYVRQTGAVVIERAAYERITRDARINDLAVSLSPGQRADDVLAAIRKLAAARHGADSALEFASAAEIRAVSLRIFDRSFAVTYWLQAVAVAIGLFGVAASFSAQVMARRKEFGLLAHLGLTRRQILAVVAGEGAAWTAIGALAGLALGIAVAFVLVHVVNPQSFHWTMDLLVPWARLAALCLAVVAAGTMTAWLSGRAAASRQAVLAVKEDW